MGAYIGENNKARKIKGAYIGVDGVARKIKKAYIGVDGIAYEVGFGPAMVTITITGSGNGVASLAINGERYYESATIEVPVGTIVQCYTSIESSSDRGSAYLSINGVKTYHETCNGIYPEYVVVGNATINLNYAYGKDKYGYIEITEE